MNNLPKPLELTDREIEIFCLFAQVVSKDKEKIQDYKINLMEEIDKAIKEGREVNISISNGWVNRLNRICNYELSKKTNKRL